jgi:hypothetical protein
MTRVAAAGLYPGASSRGLYLMNCVFCSAFCDVAALIMADPDGLSSAVFVANKIEEQLVFSDEFLLPRLPLAK